MNITIYSAPWFSTTDEHITAICERIKMPAESKVHTERVSEMHWYLDMVPDRLDLLVIWYETANVQ
jgi:hypothetical protein